MRIMVFTEGTLLMHKNALGKQRRVITKQVKNNEQSVHEYSSYIPIGNATSKLKKWKSLGHEIIYLTSRTKPDEIIDIRNVLKRHDFPEGELLFRKEGEEYRDVAERVIPDILIEDDCESIGGINKTTFINIKSQIKKKIKSILVKEFSGIDTIPDKIS